VHERSKKIPTHTATKQPATPRATRLDRDQDPTCPETIFSSSRTTQEPLENPKNQKRPGMGNNIDLNPEGEVETDERYQDQISKRSLESIFGSSPILLIPFLLFSEAA
jgi:hypothetical protein